MLFLILSIFANLTFDEKEIFIIKYLDVNFDKNFIKKTGDLGVFYNKTKEAYLKREKLEKNFQKKLMNISDFEFDLYETYYNFFSKTIRKTFELSDSDKFFFDGKKIEFFDENFLLRKIDENLIDHEKSKYGIIYLNHPPLSDYANEPCLVVPIKNPEESKFKYFVILKKRHELNEFWNEFKKHGFSSILIK